MLWFVMFQGYNHTSVIIRSKFAFIPAFAPDGGGSRPDLTVRIKQLIFSHFSQHSQHKPRHGLSAGQTYRLRGIRSGLECDRPPRREESRIKETTQCFSKSGQQQESVQRAEDDALLSTRERLIMSGHITGRLISPPYLTP